MWLGWVERRRASAHSRFAGGQAATREANRRDDAVVRRRRTRSRRRAPQLRGSSWWISTSGTSFGRRSQEIARSIERLSNELTRVQSAHADTCRAVHRLARPDRAEAQPGWSADRVRDGIGRLGGVVDRLARRLTCSPTDRVSGAATRARFRWWMLVLVSGRIGGDLHRGRWQPVATAGARRRCAPADTTRPGPECGGTGGVPGWQSSCVRARRRGGVGDPTRRWFDDATRQRHRRLRVRSVPDPRQQRCVVAGVERSRHAMGRIADPARGVRRW